MSLWSVYIVRCSDHTLYTGISTDVETRVGAHNSGRGAKYTKSRRPVHLVYSILVGSKSDASRREREIKSITREEKEHLICTSWAPLW